MLRTFVERKVRRQIVHTSLIISLLAFVAILVFWYVDSMSGFVHPLRMFVNNIHGGITAFAIQLSGGTVQSITLSPAGAYLIKYQGGTDALILSAGYIGSALLGAAIFFVANRTPHLVRGLAVITGIFTVGFLLLFIRPDQTGDVVSLAICVGLGILLILLGWKGKGDINQLWSRRTLVQITMNIVAMMTALHVILDLNHLLQAPAEINGVVTNTVAAFAERVMPATSVQAIAYAWALIAILLLALAVYSSMFKPLRQIPKNDDIV